MSASATHSQPASTVAQSAEATRKVLAAQQSAASARGVVATAAPVAAALGAEVFRRGGNAYDAALTAALAETVLLPPKCGLAGDLVALCLEPGADTPEALLAIGPAAAGLAGLAETKQLRVTGPTSVGVPGAPSGYAALAERARMSRHELVAPAVRIAGEGFMWVSILDHLTRPVVELLTEHNPDGTRYLPNGHPWPVGKTVRLPGLATVLREWATLGADLMCGAIGKALSRRVLAAGGVITPDDLALSSAEWCSAAQTMLGDSRIWATPAPTHGPALLTTLTSLTGGDEPGTAGALWRSANDAFVQRERTLGDKLLDEGTSVVGAVDDEGRVVVIVHSNSFPRFGSGLILEEYQLVLSNRAGRGFSSIPGHPNFPEAGRRPATTLHAWAAGRDRATLVGATPGGINQMIWNAQTLQQIFLGETDPGTLVTAPRWAWEPGIGVARVEADAPADVVTGLIESAAQVEHVPPLSLHSVQVVAVRPRPGQPRRIAIDPREGAAAVAV